MRAARSHLAQEKRKEAIDHAEKETVQFVRLLSLNSDGPDQYTKYVLHIETLHQEGLKKQGRRARQSGLDQGAEKEDAEDVGVMAGEFDVVRLLMSQ